MLPGAWSKVSKMVSVAMFSAVVNWIFVVVVVVVVVVAGRRLFSVPPDLPELETLFHGAENAPEIG